MPPKDYKRSVREGINLMLAFAGPSGSGKTYSALMSATELCQDEGFLLVDTENNRGKHYADQFNFEQVDLRPPFTPEAFASEIKKGVDRDFRVIVVDSFSHEWEGEGGLIEIADSQTDAKGKIRTDAGKWNKPKSRHKKMMNTFLSAPVHLIFTLRARDKLDMQAVDSRGKTVPQSMGLQPICEKNFMYEMTASFTMTEDAPGIINLSMPHKLQDQHRMYFQPGRHVNPQSAAALSAWARGDKIKTPDKTLWDKAREAAHYGMGALAEFGESLSDADKTNLKPIEAELVRTAKGVSSETISQVTNPAGA